MGHGIAHQTVGAKIVIRSIVLALGFAVSTGSANASCDPERVDLRGEWGQARFSVELADTDETRALGLMHRESMATMAGMLFLYEEAQRVGFWMKNTLIPLDLIFMSPDGVVQRIHENAIPLDETIIMGGDGILAVLEINGGMAKTLGITVGSQLRHPNLDQTQAAWPCEAN